MSKPKSFFKALTETGPLIALGTALAILVSIAGPASAQFFNFPGFGGPPQRQAPPPRQGGGGGGWFGGDFFAPFQQPQQQAPRQDFSRAPAPAKRDTTPDKNVLVIGDAMADWLAYGLEDAYTEQPDMGVIRKHKTTSGLIKYQPKGEPSDWAAAARGILETEKPDVIVVMLGLNDRISIREPVVDKSDKDKDKKNDKGARAKPQTKPGEAKPGDAKPDTAAKPDDKPADTDLPQDDADNADTPAAAPEKTARNPNGVYEFRDERWVELYGKKIEELANVLKAKGVPVLWVGLPAIRGPKGTADMLFLDSLYREGAAKAGITYVDVWDGFVDEAGRFLQKGPDFEGQIRQLRSGDGVYFTKAGARKLAHYVEREITRLLAAAPARSRCRASRRKKPPAPPQQPAQAAPSFRDFFGFGSPQPPPRQFAPAPRNPNPNPAIPRPPGNVGRSAEIFR
ncbi:DUF459 domain-containing protein [Bradyrhizobium sp. SEMIA]|nr:DUF459 domain-containing protein [Bradyrhizobium sp. SEMIA]